MTDPTSPELDQGFGITLPILIILAVIVLIVMIFIIRRMGATFFG